MIDDTPPDGFRGSDMRSVERTPGTWVSAPWVPPQSRKPAPTATPQQLHDAEIAGSISWLHDGAWHVTIGNPIRAEDNVRSEAEALAWLAKKSEELYGNELATD